MIHKCWKNKLFSNELIFHNNMNEQCSMLKTKIRKKKKHKLPKKRAQMIRCVTSFRKGLTAHTLELIVCKKAIRKNCTRMTCQTIPN